MLDVSTYTGQETPDGAGSVVLARVKLNLARLGLGLGTGLLELGRRLGAQLLGLALNIVDGREGAVELRTGLVAGGLRCRLRGQGRGEAALEGVLPGEEERHDSRL